MATFHFPLQRLLELRRAAEEQARCALAGSQRATVGQQAVLDAYRALYHEAARRACADTGRLEDRGLLVNNGLHAAHARQQALAQEIRLRDCQRREADCRQQLLAAGREREVVDQLREARWQQYLAARARREQQWLDEAGSLVYQARRSG